MNDKDIFEEYNDKHHLHYAYEDNNFLSQQLISYLGNKRNLFDLIRRGIYKIQKKLNRKKIICFDGFSGSGAVSRLLKAYSRELYVNDLEVYSNIINKCYLYNKKNIDEEKIREKIEYLNSNKLTDQFGRGFIEELYAPEYDNNIKINERVFYTNTNARIIDNIRRMVDKEKNNYFYIAPLLFKASVHANTAGVFKGFYKSSFTKIGKFGGNNEDCLDRIKKEIILPFPVFSRYECPVFIYQKNTNFLIEDIPEVDVAYYDPPYNKHPYGSNYFMLNLIAEYIPPANISKVSGIPTVWNKSEYNSSDAYKSLCDLIYKTKSKFIILSYNNEGIISIDDIRNILEKEGNVEVINKSYTTYRASRNLKNRAVRVKEYLFILEK